MDERDMEEEGKDRKGKGWGIGKKIIFGIVILYLELRIRKPGGQIKHYRTILVFEQNRIYFLVPPFVIDTILFNLFSFASVTE
jgi:hypothetical protein